jgi:hypothetical protein
MTMEFSPAEIQFLTQPHAPETADRQRPKLQPMADLRSLGCPANIFNRVLEDRARRLGSRFTEFRASQNRAAHASQVAAGMGLDERIAAAKPF